MSDLRSPEMVVSLLTARIVGSAAALAGRWPHTADPATGAWTTTENGDWTGAYWSGMLWIAQSIDAPGVPGGLAAQLCQRLVSRLHDDTVSRGFLFYYGAALGAILDGNEAAADIACRGAYAVAETYNPIAQIIPVGACSEEEHSMGPQHVTIDGLVGTLPLLAWAADRCCDASLREIARRDTLRHIDMCVRPDGSVNQSAEFDPRTGLVLRRYTHKGLHATSIWARAQAWAVYALAQAMRWFPGEAIIADAAIRTAEWWLAHAPANDAPPWDFDAAPDAYRDTSAAAIAACGLLKLAQSLKPAEASRMQNAARQIVAVLGSLYLTPIGQDDQRPPGMLVEGCYNPHVDRAMRHELIWGSYYLYEAANILCGRLPPTRI